jgi:hypothetical protein
MLRTAFYSTLAVCGMIGAAPTAKAQSLTFPGTQPGYQPSFRYQYGYGVYPSYYYTPGQPVIGPVVRPVIRAYAIEYRRPDWHYWQTFGRTYGVYEAQYYANYLRSLGFDSRVHLHPL